MKTRVLVSILGISLVANIVLISRLRRTTGPDPAEVKRLEARRQALLADIDRLKGDRASQPAGPADPAAPGDRNPAAKPTATETAEAGTSGRAKKEPAVAVSAKLKDALRRFCKYQRDNREGRPQGDSGDIQDVYSTLMEYWGAITTPSNNVGRYVEFVQGLFEAGVDEAGFPLTPEQQKLLATLSTQAMSKLEGAPESPAYARQLVEMESQREYLGTMLAAMTPDQQAAMAANDIINGMGGNHERYVQEGQVATNLVQDWGTVLGLEPNQRLMLQGPAEAYAAELDRIRNELGMTAPPNGGPPEPRNAARIFEYRVRAMKAQADALKQLEEGLSPECREKLSKRRLYTYQVHR